MDSFDHYATADMTASGKWSSTYVVGSGASVTISAGNGRRSSQSLRASYAGTTGCMTQALATLVPSGAGFVIGCAFRTDVTPNATTGTGILSVYDGATAQLTLVLRNDLKLSVKRGDSTGTVLATSASAVLALNTYVSIEFKAVIDPSAGSVAVRVNGTNVIPLTTGLNTRNTANTAWSVLRVGCDADGNNSAGSSNYCDFDDLYVLDQSGSAPLNDFLGDVRVDPRYPTGAGATTGWTPNTGANWDAVNDTAPDGDTTYVSAASSPLTDTYVTQDAPVVGATIFAVQLCVNAKKSDAGTCVLAPVVRHSGADYAGTAFNPSTAYGYGIIPYATNPGTGAAWTEAGFNSAEFGIKRTA